MAEEEVKTPPLSREGWIWNRLRGSKRRDLDRLQRDLTKLQFERREFAGDPNQPDHYHVEIRKTPA